MTTKPPTSDNAFREPAEWRQWTPPIALGAAFAAFFIQPLLRFASPPELEVAALGGAVSVVGLYVALMPPMGQRNRVAWMAVLFGFFCLLMATLDRASADAAANDRRCLAIQRDMLSAAPRKKDGPALFQAFGCRPQSEGSVMVPRSRQTR